MADIGSASSSTDMNGLPHVPERKLESHTYHITNDVF